MHRPPTLRTHLVLVVLGVLIPGTLLTAFLVQHTITEGRAVLQQRMLDAARVDADALDRQFDDASKALITLAGSPALAAGDLATFHSEARRAAAAQPGWFAVILVDHDGQQLLHTDVAYGEPLGVASDTASLREVFQKRVPVVGRQLPGRRDPKPRFAIRVPVVLGARLYALSAILEPESLQRLISSRLPSNEDWARVLIDPGWTIAARSRENDRFAGTASSPEAIAQFSSGASSFFRRLNREGVSVYVASHRSVYGWTSAVAVPASIIDAPARASVGWLIVGGVLLMAVATLTVLVVSRRVSTDLASAGESAAALASGRTPATFNAHVAEGQRLHQSLESAAQLLQVRERAKEEFLAVLGHELRNPLAPVTTALELMKLRGADTMRREREVIERQISHLTRLVDDLLDVSRLTSGKIELRPTRFELRAAVDRAIDMAQPMIRQQRHELDVDVPALGLPLDADLDRIVQILVNLLMNAARYTSPYGHLSLSAHADGDQVVVACQDNGPGIAAELLPMIFDPFVQGPRAAERHDNGLGLGLAIARNLAQLHNGTLSYESVQPRGSRFTVRLPLAAADSSSFSRLAKPARLTATARRVLIVDDNADAGAMLKLALEMAGHDATLATSGEQGLSVAARDPIDAAVLDLGLPGMDGYEVARRLRAIYPHVRLVALTGFGQRADIEATTRAGFHAHCVKPVSVATVLHEIELAGTANVAPI